jgi:L-fuculose-phosphate aldolase
VRAQDLRDQLALAGRAMSRAGLVVGSGGNLSAREPGSDRFWVTAAGTFLDRLDRDDFVMIPVDADPPRAERAQASSEVALHVGTYRARPDVNAVIHLHPQVVVLLDALGERIRLITTDHALGPATGDESRRGRAPHLPCPPDYRWGRPTLDPGIPAGRPGLGLR